MKRLMFVLMLLVVMALAVTPVFALQDAPPDGLNQYQFVLVGIVASVLVYVLRLAFSRGWKPSKEQLAIGLYVVSFCLAIYFSPSSVPPFGLFSDGPSFVTAALAWVGDLLSVASPVAGFAFLIYNLLLKRVMDGLQSGVQSRLGKRQAKG